MPKNLQILDDGQAHVNLRGVSGTGDPNCFFKATLEPLLIKATHTEPKVEPSNVLGDGKFVEEFRRSPSDELDLHATIRRPALPLLHMSVPTFHRRSLTLDAGIWPIHWNADEVANEVRMLLEDSFD